MDKLENDATDWFAEIADYNPGAMFFMLDAMKISRKGTAVVALSRMKEFGIKGEFLYVLWNDCCDRNTEKALEVMMNNSKDDILDHLCGLSRERYNFKKF